MSDVRDFVYGAIEGVLIRVRRFRKSGQLPNELKRRRANLVIGRRRCKIMQGLNVSAHEESLTADCADENGFCLGWPSVFPLVGPEQRSMEPLVSSLDRCDSAPSGLRRNPALQC